MKLLFLILLVSCSPKINSEQANAQQAKIAKERAAISNTLRNSSEKFKGTRGFSSVTEEVDVDKDLDENIQKRKEILRSFKE